MTFELITLPLLLMLGLQVCVHHHPRLLQPLFLNLTRGTSELIEPLPQPCAGCHTVVETQLAVLSTVKYGKIIGPVSYSHWEELN